MPAGSRRSQAYCPRASTKDFPNELLRRLEAPAHRLSDAESLDQVDALQLIKLVERRNVIDTVFGGNGVYLLHSDRRKINEDFLAHFSHSLVGQLLNGFAKIVIDGINDLLIEKLIVKSIDLPAHDIYPHFCASVYVIWL